MGHPRSVHRLATLRSIFPGVLATFNTGLGSFHRCTIQTRLKTHEPHGLVRFDSVRVTRSKNRRLVPKTAHSFQIRPTRSKNGRPWKKTADPGKKRPTLAIRTVCGYPME